MKNEIISASDDKINNQTILEGNTIPRKGTSALNSFMIEVPII